MFGRHWNINKREKSNKHTSREQYGAAARFATSPEHPLACCEFFRQWPALCHWLQWTLCEGAGRVTFRSTDLDTFIHTYCFPGKFENSSACVKGHVNQFSPVINRRHHFKWEIRAWRCLCTTKKTALQKNWISLLKCFFRKCMVLQLVPFRGFQKEHQDIWNCSNLSNMSMWISASIWVYSLQTECCLCCFLVIAWHWLVFSNYSQRESFGCCV